MQLLSNCEMLCTQATALTAVEKLILLFGPATVLDPFYSLRVRLCVWNFVFFCAKQTNLKPFKCSTTINCERFASCCEHYSLQFCLVENLWILLQHFKTLFVIRCAFVSQFTMSLYTLQFWLLHFISHSTVFVVATQSTYTHIQFKQMDWVLNNLASRSDPTKPINLNRKLRKINHIKTKLNKLWSRF